MSKILITGATGQLGAAVTDALLKRTDAAKIKVLVRNKAKAVALEAKGVEIAEGDYDNYTSLVAAFTGMDKLYFVSGSELDKRAEQHRNVVKAAVEAGIKQVVYTSIQRTDEAGTAPIDFVAQSHYSTEQALKESGLNYTLLLHNLYEDLIPMWAGPKLLENHTFYFPAGDGKTAFALRTDMAEAGAVILSDDTDKYYNKSIDISGSEAVSFQQIAADISGITGHQINYVSPPVDEFETTLKQGGLPEEVIHIVSGFAQTIAKDTFSQVSPELEEILGRRPVTVKEYLQSVYGK